MKQYALVALAVCIIAGFCASYTAEAIADALDRQANIIAEAGRN